MGGSGEIMQVVAGGGKIMTDRGWWLQNYGWFWVVEIKLWLVVGGDDKIMAGRGWLWVVSRFSIVH